jgi:predicted metal-dependent hydrolase
MADKSSLQVKLSETMTTDVAWVRSPRSRNLRLSLTAKGLRLSTPPRVGLATVTKFLEQQKAWIAAHLKLRPQLEQNTLLYFGRPYKVEVKNDMNEATGRIRSEGGVLQLYPVSYSSESAVLLLERWLRTQASEFCTPILRNMAEKMDVEVPLLRFKETHTRWGSCSHAGAITLNWRLIHTPAEVIRYVVIHELAHRVHLNHSDRFWQLVEKHDPDFRVHRGWLKRHGHLSHTPEITLS